jgi:hypothetical protein
MHRELSIQIKDRLIGVAFDGHSNTFVQIKKSKTVKIIQKWK